MLNTFNKWLSDAFLAVLALGVLGFGLMWPMMALLSGSSAAMLGEDLDLGLWFLFLVTVPGIAGVAMFRVLLGLRARSRWLLAPLVFPVLWLFLPVVFAAA
ncbi:hypothetical protein [Actinocorallia populi]|uniref:hypothetical protein n=1 Tax=Actinocorallia populi TaxID=2079200 RepID=UPI001300A868|nr:hypothetical protein [Actinocorallia populi]